MTDTDPALQVPRGLSRYYFSSQGPPGALYDKERLKANKTGPRPKDQEVEALFAEHPVLTRFYGVKRKTPQHVRNAYATYPLQRVHADLMHMSQEFGAYLYGAVFIDSFSRFCLVVPIKNKQVDEMQRAFTEALRVFAPFRKYAKQVTFLTDLGKSGRVEHTWMES